jgi:hypothetical protein
MTDRELNQYRLIEQAQDRFRAELYGIEGINGSAVGLKATVPGVRGEPALVIFVDKELNVRASAQSIAIFEKIRSTGVDIDVVEHRNTFVPLALTEGSTDEQLFGNPRKDVMDPIIGGVACGPDVNVLKAPWNGTLGLTVSLDTQQLGILSNQHVMFYDQQTKTVCQPARGNSIKNHLAGDNLVAMRENVGLKGRQTFIDAAVATVVHSRKAATKRVFGINDPVAGTISREQIKIGQNVIKSGLSTGITTGIVRHVSIDAPHELNQFAIEGDNDAPFADDGDSGSVVLVRDAAGDLRVMGLLWGRNKDEAGKTFAIVSPIEAVTEALNISI